MKQSCHTGAYFCRVAALFAIAKNISWMSPRDIKSPPGQYFICVTNVSQKIHETYRKKSC